MAEAVIQPLDRIIVRSGVVRDVLAIAGWFALISAAYWIAVLCVCGRVGFPLDDAFIHLQFARNLYCDGQMAFNAGVASTGSTAPLYPVLLAAAYCVVRDWYLASYLLGGLGGLGMALAVYGIIRSWTGRQELARWAGLLTALTGPTVALAYSGMESPAYGLLFLLGLWLYAADTWRLAGSALLAFGIFLRPELAVLLPLMLLERAIAARRLGGRRVGAWLRWAWPHVAIWGVVAAIYVSYHWHQDGHWVPSTFAAKFMAPNEARPDWLDSLPTAIQKGHWWAALLAMTVWPFLVLNVVGIGLGTVCAPLAFGLGKALAALWRDRGPAAAGWRLAILTLVGYPFLRGMVDTCGAFWFQQHRYYAHITPLAIIIVLGALPMTRAVVKRSFWDWTGVDWATQQNRTLAWAGVYTLVLGALSVVSVSNITDMQVRIAEWLRQDAGENRLIATNDIGAIAFISERPVLDTVGLVEPAVVQHLMSGGRMLDYLEERDPGYVVIFPKWYPELAARQDLLEPVYSVDLGWNVVCGGPRMVVYRPLWKKPERDLLPRAGGRSSCEAAGQLR